MISKQTEKLDKENVDADGAKETVEPKKTTDIKLPSREELLGIKTEVSIDNESTEKEKKFHSQVAKGKELAREEGVLGTISPNVKDGAKVNKKSSNIEEEARSQGWVPQDEYKGDPDNWRTAKEFVERGALIDQLKNLSKSIKEKDKTNEDLLRLLQGKALRDSEKEVTDILKRKRDAIADGDIEAVEKYEKEYNVRRNEYESFKQMRLKEQEEQKIIDKSDIPPEVQEFMERNNEWFNQETADNAAMYAFAGKKDNELAYQYPEWTLQRRLFEIEKIVKATFPQNFENVRRNSPQRVEGGGIERKNSKKPLGFDDLPVTAKKVVTRLMRNVPSARINRDEIARQMFETGALDDYMK